MRNLTLNPDPSYVSPEKEIGILARLLPSLVFHIKQVHVVWAAGRLAKAGKYGELDWAESSDRIFTALESVGARLDIKGLEKVRRVAGPCVIIGNHMSTLETFVLPSLLIPAKSHTFVVKEALLTYPIFKYVMRSRNPIAVNRSNPREDFKTVMEEGKKRLENGISVVVFPQTTRTADFDPSQFNSIGVKLAKKAGVPVIPLALKTDAWGNGPGFFKDFGKIDPSKRIYIEFGEALRIEGNGQEENDRIISFIQEQLQKWQDETKGPDRRTADPEKKGRSISLQP
ncbi:MAG: 1-acyl-sn-glycerol-3-phosphate acyltransferase [Deltaproteobacteria bacterium]|nr:1-acyl-sn-glycerol-3-phosphate acyltransferase [Deltaproteobacteria bacterium]